MPNNSIRSRPHNLASDTLLLPDLLDKKGDRTFIKYDANNSGVYILTMTSSKKADESHLNSYSVTWFDSKGLQQETVNLNVRFHVMHFGVFPDGKLFVLGLDTINLSPEAAILHEDGSMLTFVNLTGFSAD